LDGKTETGGDWGTKAGRKKKKPPGRRKKKKGGGCWVTAVHRFLLAKRKKTGHALGETHRGGFRASGAGATRPVNAPGMGGGEDRRGKTGAGGRAGGLAFFFLIFFKGRAKAASGGAW